MTKQSKRMQHIATKVSKLDVYPVADAFKLLAEFAEKIKFKESVDVAIRLGIDAKKSDQSIRGAAVLPHGTGKTNRVAVFAEAVTAEEAKNAGADLVGFEDLITDIKAGKIAFDVLITTPEYMPKLAKLGQVLGPKGLMPNKKSGTLVK